MDTMKYRPTKQRNLKGSNQYRRRDRTKRTNALLLASFWIAFPVILVGTALTSDDKSLRTRTAEAAFISPLPRALPTAVPAVSATPTPSDVLAGSPDGEEAPSELEQIVAYIARKFEPEGKDVVVRAINCFYSESGLRRDAVGQNSDGPRSRDHGVAQLNDYWHKLTDQQKTDIYANIDKAYEIYKGRGNSFEAWYGRLCN